MYEGTISNAECGLTTTDHGTADNGVRTDAEFGMHCWDAKAGKVVKRTGVGVKWTRSEPGCILFAPGEAQLAQGPFSRVKRSG